MHTDTEQRRRERVRALATQLHRDRYGHLLRIARRNGAAAEADAEEAVGSAFLSFLDRFDPDCGSPPLGWITLTVQRSTWAAARRRRRECHIGEAEQGAVLVPSSGSAAPGPEEAAERAERLAEARGRLATLKPAERRTLVLIGAGYSYREAGEITGFSDRKIRRCAEEGRAALQASAGR